MRPKFIGRAYCPIRDADEVTWFGLWRLDDDETRRQYPNTPTQDSNWRTSGALIALLRDDLREHLNREHRGDEATELREQVLGGAHFDVYERRDR